MAGLYYQPVGLPSLGGATQTSSRAADLISTGLSGLGDKITGLGDRRQRRLDEEQARKNARGLEILQLAAANATSEAELDSIAGQLGLLPGGNTKDAVVIPGSAAAINARRSEILGDDKSRGDARSSIAGAGLKEVELTDAQRTSAAEANLADAQKQYAGRLAEVQALSFSNDPRYKEAAIALNNDMAASHGITANDIFDQAETNRTLTDTTNTDLSSNALTRVENETARQESVGSRAVTAATQETERLSSIGSRAVTAATQERQTYGQTQGLKDDILRDQDAANARTANEFVSNLKTTGLSDELNIQAIRNSDYSEAMKVKMIEAYNSGTPLNVLNPIQDEGFVYDQGGREISDITNVARTVSNMLFDTNLPVNQADQLPVGRMKDGITGMVQTQIDADPDMSIYARAQERDQSGEFDGFADDIGLYIQKQFPALDWEQNQLKLIKTVQTEEGLTPAEMLVLVGESIATQGVIFNSPELADKQLRAKAKAYKEGKPAVVRRYNALRKDETDASLLQSRINKHRLTQERARQAAEAAGEDYTKDETYLEYGDKIRQLAQQMATIEGRLATRGSDGTQDAVDAQRGISRR